MARKKAFSKSPENIKFLFNSISINYDKLNDIMSFCLHKKIKKKIVSDLHLPNNSKILDLCTGTGDLAGILKQKYPNTKIIGVDFSLNMLEIARKKYINFSDIEFIQADITHLPFENESFDLCVISFGLRNIEKMEQALQEIYRVLKPKGLFINLDLGKPNKFFNLFLRPYMYLWITFLGKLFNGDETPYKYLADSNETFPSPKELCKIYEKIGFFDIKNTNYLFGQISSQYAKKE